MLSNLCPSSFEDMSHTSFLGTIEYLLQENINQIIIIIDFIMRCLILGTKRIPCRCCHLDQGELQGQQSYTQQSVQAGDRTYSMSIKCGDRHHKVKHLNNDLQEDELKKAIDLVNLINLQLKASELLKVTLQFLLEHKDQQKQCSLQPVCI